MTLKKMMNSYKHLCVYVCDVIRAERYCIIKDIRKLANNAKKCYTLSIQYMGCIFFERLSTFSHPKLINQTKRTYLTFLQIVF